MARSWVWLVALGACTNAAPVIVAERCEESIGAVSASALGTPYDSLYRLRTKQVLWRGGLALLREHMGHQDSTGEWRLDLNAMREPPDSAAFVARMCMELDGKTAEEISRLPDPTQ